MNFTEFPRFLTIINSWKVTGGTDRSGDALDMAVVFENGLVVITVF